MDVPRVAYAPVLLERKAAKLRKEMYGHRSQKKLDAEDADAEKKGVKRRRIRTVFENADRKCVVIPFSVKGPPDVKLTCLDDAAGKSFSNAR
jgi:hypothetical protein